MDSRENKLLHAQCRELLTNHESTLKYVIEEIITKTKSQKINGDTSFEIAKETIRRQGIEEGLTALLQKITYYGDKP